MWSPQVGLLMFDWFFCCLVTCDRTPSRAASSAIPGCWRYRPGWSSCCKSHERHVPLSLCTWCSSQRWLLFIALFFRVELTVNREPRKAKLPSNSAWLCQGLNFRMFNGKNSYGFVSSTAQWTLFIREHCHAVWGISGQGPTPGLW